MATYCEPNDIDSIRHAIDKAYHAPADDTLQSFIKNNYTWNQAAQQTLEAYKTALLS
jgi:hypothetical protein